MCTSVRSDSRWQARFAGLEAERSPALFLGELLRGRRATREWKVLRVCEYGSLDACEGAEEESFRRVACVFDAEGRGIGAGWPGDRGAEEGGRVGKWILILFGRTLLYRLGLWLIRFD